MHRTACLVIFASSLGCIEAPPLRTTPAPLRLVAVESPLGDLDALGRLPSLTLRFDRPLAWPVEGVAMLLTGAPGDALRSDAGDGRLSATNALRRVPARLSLDPRDASVMRLDATQALLPDAPLALLVTPLARGLDGAAFEAPDGGARALSFELTVAPARRCGALAHVAPVALADTPLGAARVHVRFDRAVRGVRGEAPFALFSDAGLAVPSRASLDCFDDDAMARCGWLEPAVTLDPRTVYRLGFGPLTARNNVRVEVAASAFVTGQRRDATRVAFGPSPVCARDEVADGAFCARSSDRWIELRASTTLPAIVRVTATANARASVAIGAPSTLHTVRVAVPFAAAEYALTVECLGADGRAHDTQRLTRIATAAALPRVRITEVVARPHSTSAQEYVELLNDDTAPADLSGYALAQGTARSSLPAGSVIAPGQRALVVGASFDPRGVPAQGDPPVAPGTTLIALTGSVAGRGLRDTGADVTLTDETGRILSHLPGSVPSRAPRAGVGIVRAERDLDDEDPAAWSYDALDGCTPGAPDRLR
jgi:hypothetical protein